MLKMLLGAIGLYAYLIFPCDASDYCHHDKVYIVGGETVTGRFKVVVSSVPRPVFPGHSADRPWCTQDWKSLGMNEKPKLLEAPANGELRLDRTTVSYKGDRVGHDRFVISKSWYGPNNDLRTSTIIYEVDVVAAPF